ncbi:putative quinol monooxygenase [Burkholderia sp. ZZQ-2]|uniref:putative quinol monooxygenase n=1 Tax=unclassified Burkholderia TaxID=2613784 RepID=UPI003D6F0D23
MLQAEMPGKAHVIQRTCPSGLVIRLDDQRGLQGLNGYIDAARPTQHSTPMKTAHDAPRFGPRRAVIFATVLVCALALFAGHHNAYAQEPQMLIRISEIEIFPEHLEEYQRILNEEAEASVRLEPGVMCIFPSAQKDNPTQIRILEIYASREAYESHIKSPHFQKYKTSTLEMVKSLRLVDMQAMDAKSMPLMFKKMSRQP